MDIEKLKLKFGIIDFKDGQEGAISAAINDFDVLCFMPTGYGKSVCFQLPSQIVAGLTIVVSPLIALMEDQVRELKEVGVSALAIHADAERDVVHGDLKAGKSKLIYVSPERLSNPAFVDYMCNRNIARIVVDEAHCISLWGGGFRPDYANIGKFVSEVRKRSSRRIPVSAFTATANKDVVKDIVRSLGIDTKSAFFYKGELLRKNLSISMRKSKDRNAEALSSIRSNPTESIIVYCQTIKDVVSFSHYLKKNRVHNSVFHSKLSSAEKKSILSSFVDDKVKVIVATSAFGMGVNKNNVRSVIHLGVPDGIEMYYQQIGRAGRDGLPASALMLYSSKDKSLNRFMVQLSYPKVEIVTLLYHYFLKNSKGGMFDQSVDDVLMHSPVPIKESDLHSIVKVLESHSIIKCYHDMDRSDVRFEIITNSNSLDMSLLERERSRAVDNFDKLFALAESEFCRSYSIASFFNGAKQEYYECGNCDNCLSNLSVIDDDTHLMKHLLADMRKVKAIGLDSMAVLLKGYGKKGALKSYGALSKYSLSSVKKWLRSKVDSGELAETLGVIFLPRESVSVKN